MARVDKVVDNRPAGGAPNRLRHRGDLYAHRSLVATKDVARRQARRWEETSDVEDAIVVRFEEHVRTLKGELFEYAVYILPADRQSFILEGL